MVAKNVLSAHSAVLGLCLGEMGPPFPPEIWASPVARGRGWLDCPACCGSGRGPARATRHPDSSCARQPPVETSTAYNCRLFCTEEGLRALPVSFPLPLKSVEVLCFNVSLIAFASNSANCTFAMCRGCFFFPFVRFETDASPFL